MNEYDGELHNTYIIHGHDPHDIKPPLERKLGLLLSPKPPSFTHRCHFLMGGGLTHLKRINVTPFKKKFTPDFFVLFSNPSPKLHF